MSLALKIPTGDTPDWETKGTIEDDGLNSVSESSTLYFSLRQSRNAWLSNLFPRFASKPKSKNQKDAPLPPHNLRFIAKCDIEIGPHIFSDTSIYEAHYFPETVPYASPSTYSHPMGYSQTATYSYPLTGYSPYVAPSPSAGASSQSSVATEPPLEVTPTLIAQVNEAAASNPTLHNLLQTAAAGEASMDQLRTLGFFIQSLAAAQQQASQQMPTANVTGIQSAASSSTFSQASQYSPPRTLPKKHDLVLEFRESHTERFLVPREVVACEQEIPQAETFRKDIVLYTFVPFLNDESKFKAFLNDTTPASSRSPTVLRFLNVSDVLWESIRGWVNEEAKGADAWESFYDKVEVSGPRKYLQYRLPNGDLLSQLRAACSNGYTMKSIKPPTVSDSASAKRARARRAAAQAAKIAKTADASNTPDAHATPPTNTEDEGATKEGGSKKRKASLKGASAPPAPVTNGLQFINTAPPPVSQEQIGQPSATVPQLTVNQPSSQAADSVAP